MISKLISKEVEEKKEIEFPCLMRSNGGLIVLMYREGVGTVLVGNDTWDLGEYSDSWDTDSFTPLDPSEKVILTNGDEVD